MNKKTKIILMAIATLLIIGILGTTIWQWNKNKTGFDNQKKSIKDKTSCIEHNQSREANNGKSSITDEINCDVKNYNPEQDCLITKYLEKNMITGSRFGGVNFCTYKILGQEGLTKYIVPICEEYYVVDYKLKCENIDKKTDCLNLGADGSVDDNFEEKSLSYLKDGIKKCDPSCKYEELKNKILNTGEGHAGKIAKITINKNGDIDYWNPEFAYKTEGDDYLLKNIPEKYLKKSMEYDKTGGAYKNGELFNWNRERAEDYFCLKYDEKMIYDY